MTKKILAALALALALGTLSARPVLAADTTDPMVSIVGLPEYTNRDNFEISYTALDSGGSGLASVLLEYHKEGQGWQTLGTYTTNSGSFAVTSNQINEEKKYYFRATASDGAGNASSSETSTTVDRSAPPSPESYSKEKVGDQSYRLKWHNTDSDEIFQVYVYRSATTGFTADSNTLIAQVNVNKNTDTIWDNAVPDTANYFYILRGVDRAGNAANPVGDVVVVTETTSGNASVPNGQPVTGKEKFSGQVLTGKSGSVLGEDSSATAGATPTPTQESAASAVTENFQEAVKQVTSSSKFWPMMALGALAAVVYWFLFRK